MNIRSICAVVMLVAAFGLPRAKDLMSKVELPTINKPDAAPVVVVSEKQVWEDLAAWCDAGQVQDTDELRRLANGLKTLGKLSDISRLDKYATNGPVTAEVIAALRQ
jgi:hypothetical protein